MADIRVLRIISDLQVGGVQRQMLRTAGYLRQWGVETEVCCQKYLGPLAKIYEEQNYQVHLIPFKTRMQPSALLALRKLAVQGNFHIVHAHQYQSCMGANYALFGNRRVKIVNSYHSFQPVHSASQSFQLRLTRGKASRFIAVSEAVKQPLLKAGIPDKKIVVIHNGVEIHGDPTPIPPRKADEPIRLLYAGRFVKQKRLELMLDVIERCAQREIPVHLTMLGDGPTFGRIARLINQRNLTPYIDTPGVSHEVPAWLEKSHLYLSTSEREGFANSLLECSAAGRGFVASDIPPHREMQNGTQCGILAPDDPDAYADALKDLAAHPEKIQTMGTAAFARVQEFSDENTARKYLDLYRDILGSE
ncbi:MAG: glycosyltransferase family 4 protein [bacterium]